MNGPLPRGGRPRDPDVDKRALAAARAILAGEGLAGFTADAVAAAARVGKASIYRRWRTLDLLLVDVVRTLGVRDVDHGRGVGALFTDLARMLHAATSGPGAAAEAAVLSAVGGSPELRVAYMAGPATRLVRAINCVEVRGRHRGEPEWHAIDPIVAAHRFLMHQALTDGEQPTLLEAGRVVEVVVLPALRQSA